ncbi:response regulator transcription factor [Novosphingobium album (ex Liu et al. 2023)]|uniref:response regulator transcription factor n=1 Tax=Novosphingobium album (ex Liu et al. 2023) TaxID=3031130 RepID=UPI0023AF423A|nr:response regulator transcription factor [Novosphingobium album (ex Liu et al. 2023)]
MIVEDEPCLRRLMQRTLSAAGHAVAATDWDRFWEKPDASEHDAVLLDLMTVDRMEEAIGAIRQRSDAIVVVILSREAREHWPRAFDQGADDFLLEPFDTDDLVARIRVALRRHLTRNGGTAVCRAGDVMIDLLDRRVTRDGRGVDLTRKEFLVLLQLARFPGRLVTHDEIIQTIWSVRKKNAVAYLRVLIQALRRKLGDWPAQARIIENVMGSGYRLRAIPT